MVAMALSKPLGLLSSLTAGLQKWYNNAFVLESSFSIKRY
jgi:hypothetical protein